MSGRLNNPLDKFQSYSTHFILLACRTTENARKFSQSSESAALQAINDTANLGAPVKSFGNDVFLVLDTRRFNQFTVQNMKYEVLMSGLQDKHQHGNLITTIDVTIIDSVGISFINYLQWLMDTKMQCGFDGMIFMFRVIFVGHNADGTTETVQTVSIPCHLHAIEVNLDHAKGEYHCEFMPNFNFATYKHNRWTHIGMATNYFTGKGNKLGDLVDSFEAALNADSLSFFKTVSAAILKTGARPSETRPGEFGRLVQYMITIPPEWRDFVCDGASINEAIERTFVKKEKTQQTPQQQASTTPGNAVTPAMGTHISVEPGLTIPEVLRIIFESCSAIQELANEAKLLDPNKFVTFEKYLVSISSDKDSFVVHVDVIPFEVPNVPPPESGTPPVSPPVSPLINPKFFQEYTDPATNRKFKRPKNFFEMDYIFTGKNLDILSFDLKIQNLLFLLASNVKVGEGELFALSAQGQADNFAIRESALPKTLLTSARPYDPILLPMLTKEQRKAFSQFATAHTVEEQVRKRADSLAYSRNLSAFYAQSPNRISMKIKGNPHIMQKFNIDTPVENIRATSAGASGPSATNATVKKEYRRKLEESILRTGGGNVTRTDRGFSLEHPLGEASFITTPVFVLVNIKGPNVDPVTNQLINDKDFATEVLYRNYYVVQKVTNNIDNGVFTQDLELWTHNVYGRGTSNTEAANAKQAETK